MTTPEPEGHRTSMVMMKGPDADATIEVLAENSPEVLVVDRGPFWKLYSPGDIHIDLHEVAEYLGEPITMARWLIIMSSYVGRASTTPDSFTIHAGNPELEEVAG